MACCRAGDVGVLVYSPLAQGQLTGWAETPGAAGRRSLSTMPNYELDLLQAARSALDEIATSRSVSMSQVALAWLIAQPGVTSAIVGVTKLAQLVDNLAAARLELHPDELDALNAATAPRPLYPATLDHTFGFAAPTRSGASR